MMDAHDSDAHDRTHRLAKLLGIDPRAVHGLATRRVVLELGLDEAATEVGRLAFLTLCNLATRLGPYVPNLEFSVPASAPSVASRVYSRGETLRDQAIWILREAICAPDLVRQPADPEATYDVAISLGAPAIVAGTHLHVGWDGWLGMVGEQHDAVHVERGTNPLGALVAVAMATARLHALQLASIGARISSAGGGIWRLNAMKLADKADGPPLPADGLSLPRLLLVGAGALGSAFSYAMAHIPGLRAEGDAVDHDVLKPSNANRQITAPFERALDEKTHKVDDLAACWPALVPIPLRYEMFKAEYGRSASNYEIAVTAVDNAEARRDVAGDLPKVVIDGATAGLMVAVMRGADPAMSCVSCQYAEIATDEDGLWSRRLGTSRERVQQLRSGTLAFDDEVVSDVREHGTLTLDDWEVEALRKSGWNYLVSARCATAKPDRDLPSASVSYVSALCGFLIAAQVLAEALGAPVLGGSQSRWVWEDVLGAPPRAAWTAGETSPACVSRHERRARIYRNRWPAQADC